MFASKTKQKKMAKKKKVVKKKVVGKKSRKVVSKVKPASVSKSDFEVFAKGVERLKELKSELDGLDTRGFSKDAQAIRGRLKTVSEIPSIEVDLKKLRAKIDNKFKPKKRRSVPRANKDIGEIKEELPRIERKIREIGSKVDRIGEKKRKVDSGVGELVEVGFDNFLNDLKSGVSERIKTKEKQVAFILKRDLKEHERMFKKKHSDMVSDFRTKRSSLEKDYHGKMSSGREKLMVEFRKKVDENKKKVEDNRKMVALTLKRSAEAEAQLERDKSAEVEKIRVGLAKNKAEFVRKKNAEAARRKEESVRTRELFDKERKKLEQKRKKLEQKRIGDTRKLEQKRIVDAKELEQKRIDDTRKLEQKKIADAKKIDSEMKAALALKKREFDKIQAGLEKGRVALEKKRINDAEELEKNMRSEIEKQKVMLSNKYQKMFKGFFEQKSSAVLKGERAKLQRSFTKAGEKERIRMKIAFHDKLERELAEKIGDVRKSMKEEFETNFRKKIREHDVELKKKSVAHDAEMKRKMAEHDKQLEKDRKNLRVEIRRKMARILG